MGLLACHGFSCSHVFQSVCLARSFDEVSDPCGINQISSRLGPNGHANIFGYSDLNSQHVEPRVHSLSMHGSEALEKSRAKVYGSNSVNETGARQPGNTGKKRALRRAHGRASRSILGGTWYRGRWFTEQMLRSTYCNQPAMARPLATSVARGQEIPAGSRIKVTTYNVGGITSDSCDTVANWLQEQKHADIFVLQEIHWGLGKEDTCFTTGKWHVVTCTDTVQRFSGVAVCISDKLCSTDDLRFASHVLGRLLHVRWCLGIEFCIGIAGMYQWAWNTQKISATEHRRQMFGRQQGDCFHSSPAGMC